MFICSVTESRVLSDKETMTYTYYQSNVKPKPKTEGVSGYVCKICTLGECSVVYVSYAVRHSYGGERSAIVECLLAYVRVGFGNFNRFDGVIRFERTLSDVGDGWGNADGGDVAAAGNCEMADGAAARNHHGFKGGGNVTDIIISRG